MKLAGAALILLSAMLAALTLLREGRERTREYRALQSALLSLRSELSEKQTPLPQAFRLLSESMDQARTCRFFLALSEKMTNLGETRFSAMWQETVQRELAALGQDACTLLVPLGELLGGSELALQCDALQRTAESFGALAEENDARCAERRRMTLGLSFSLGAFLIILLI